MVTSGVTSRGMTGKEWGLMVLLVSSIFINYIDRGNLSVAAPLLEHELSLTPAQLGSLLASFFWTYSLLQLFGIAGWLTDRFHVGVVFAVGFLLWSGATALTGFVTSYASLFAMRLVLGAGESVAYPCYSKILATDVPQHHRGKANALIDAGSKLGPALGTLIGGLLIARWGWRAFFIALGAGCLVWLVPWLIWMPEDHRAVHKYAAGSPGIAEILSQRSAWGAFLGHFCGNYFWFFLLTWLPMYLVRERHFSMTAMAEIGSIAYVVMASATVAAGWFSDRLIRLGASATQARKGIAVSGLPLSTIILPVAAMRNEVASTALLFAACMAFGTYTSNHWAMTQTLAGPLAAGRWTSVQNGIGNLAGIAAPWITGQVVERTGSFHLAFLVAAVVVLTGALMWGLLVGPIEEVPWRARVSEGATEPRA